MKRSERKIQSATNWQFILGLLCVVFLVASGILLAEKINDSVKTKPTKTSIVQKKKTSSSLNGVQTARIMANGDLLYHDLLYMSVLQSDGTYDFTENYQYVKPWLKKADLVLGDFEGTIRPNYPLAGYPLFNAPESVVSAIKDAGYQVVDLAHNHILDFQQQKHLSSTELHRLGFIHIKIGIKPHL